MHTVYLHAPHADVGCAHHALTRAEWNNFCVISYCGLFKERERSNLGLFKVIGSPALSAVGSSDIFVLESAFLNSPSWRSFGHRLSTLESKQRLAWCTKKTSISDREQAAQKKWRYSADDGHFVLCFTNTC